MFYSLLIIDKFKRQSCQSSVIVQWLSRVQLFAIPWTVALQASLSFTISQSFLKLNSTESVMPSIHLILCCLLLLLCSIFPSIRVFPISWPFASGGQSIRVSASASVLPMNIQGWFPLGLTGLFSMQSKELLRVFSSTTVWRHQFFVLSLYIVCLSHSYVTTGKNRHLTIDLCRQSNISAF